VVGQTASGKSELGLKIAKTWNGEIICADSTTIRRGINIGTAKPNDQQRKCIRHHLVDIIEPDEPFNVARFKKLALQVIQDIVSQGKLPIMVGGSGLYIDSVLYDYDFVPPSSTVNREELNKLPLAALLVKVQQIGLDITGVDVKNKRRLINLIKRNGRQPKKHNLRPHTLLIGIHSANKKILKRRIEMRLNDMLEDGLEEEVQKLIAQYGWECEALKGIGYREWREYFLGSINREELCQNIIQSTMDLAKRQQTWFQRNKSIHWLTAPVSWPVVVDLVTTFLGTEIS
jgi:tRNA dimethylallyltransferase